MFNDLKIMFDGYKSQEGTEIKETWLYLIIPGLISYIIIELLKIIMCSQDKKDGGKEKEDKDMLEQEVSFDTRSKILNLLANGNI